MAMRECPYCGKIVYDRQTQCTYCRETLPELRLPKAVARPAEGGDGIRRGLLFMLLAASIAYFSSSVSALTLPILVPPAVTIYLSPLLFLSGLGLSLHGLYLRHKTSL